MKTKLLLLALIVSAFGYSQTYDHTTYFISEIIPSPPNNSGLFNDTTDTPLVAAYEYAVDDCIEYFEFRGPASATIPADTYFIVVDGDGATGDISPNTNVGKVRDAIDLSGLAFGSNGILSIAANMTFDTGSLDSDGTTDIAGVTITNPYATELAAATNATVVTVELTGTPAWLAGPELDKFNSVSAVPSKGYDGSINDQSATYMIVKTGAGAGSPKNLIVDTDQNGVLDGDALGWTIYDSVSIIDEDDADNAGEHGEFAYGKIIFVERVEDFIAGSQLFYDSSLSPTIVSLNQYPNYVARQGASTGFAASIDANDTNDDWMAGRVNSRSYPDWKFSSTATRNIPASLTGTNLVMSYGEANIDYALSVDNALASKFSVYPNPVKDFLTIDARNINISSVNVFNVLGTKVLERKELTENKLDVSSLSNGIYFLKISADNATVTKKFIVE